MVILGCLPPFFFRPCGGWLWGAACRNFAFRGSSRGTAVDGPLLKFPPECAVTSMSGKPPVFGRRIPDQCSFDRPSKGRSDTLGHAPTFGRRDRRRQRGCRRRATPWPYACARAGKERSFLPGARAASTSPGAAPRPTTNGPNAHRQEALRPPWKNIRGLNDSPGRFVHGLGSWVEGRPSTAGLLLRPSPEDFNPGKHYGRPTSPPRRESPLIPWTGPIS